MIEYDEATAIRRSTRLVLDTEGVNPSVLVALTWLVLVALLVAAFAAVFGAI